MRKRALDSTINKVRYVPYSFEKLYYSLVPATVSSKNIGGNGKITKIYGDSVVENQLFPVYTNSSWYSNYLTGLTVTDNKCVWNFTETTPYIDSASRFCRYRPLVNGHKYLIAFHVKHTGNSARQFLLYCGSVSFSNVSVSQNVDTIVSSIFTANSTGDTICGIASQSLFNSGETLEYSTNLIIDLTQMFPFDTPTTLTDVRVQALLNRGYIEYNKGEIKSVDISEFSSEPYNLLSLDRTAGTLSGGSPTNARQFEENKYYIGFNRINYYDESAISNLTISNNDVSFQTSRSGFGLGYPIKAIPNRTYIAEANMISVGTGNTILSISYFDKDGNYISVDYDENTNTSKTVTSTAPSNAYWIVFGIAGTNG